MRAGGAAVLFATVLLAVAGCGGGPTETVTVTTTVGEKTGVGVPAEHVVFGYAKEMVPAGDHYSLRFDPALVLSGETANLAAAEDGVVALGEPVPNDTYLVDEGHRLFTYVVPSEAHVTVLRDGVEGSEITVEELAQLVGGRNPFGKPLFEPITTGFWMRVHVDTVRALDQQYRP